jgi:hypothetical protein
MGELTGMLLKTGKLLYLLRVVPRGRPGMFWQAERVNPRCRMPPSRLSAGRSSALYGIMIASLPADPDARGGSRQAPGLIDNSPSLGRFTILPTEPTAVVRHKAGDPVWLSNFSINERKVEDYRSGRVFVAGEAAHVHSPAGGQGMNTGMQDAFNLTWNLALVSSGLCRPEPLLSSYSIERRPHRKTPSRIHRQGHGSLNHARRCQTVHPEPRCV